MDAPRISHIFGREAPVQGLLVGYGLIMREHELRVPLPRRLALVTQMRGRSEREEWLLFGMSYLPAPTLRDHLVFALKYEGVDLHLLAALFGRIGAEEVLRMVREEPTSRYGRRLWFLYEWLTGSRLELADTDVGSYVDAIDADLQYPGPVRRSRRHGVRNNLPGTPHFCPLVHRTPMLEQFRQRNLVMHMHATVRAADPVIVRRAEAALALEDSRASYALEGESPAPKRTQRWAHALQQAGMHPLTRERLEELQSLVFEAPRIPLGYRVGVEGFVGTRHRYTQDPVPDHISARSADVPLLMGGLIDTAGLLGEASFDPVIAAAMIAFGFVFIHPFVDGNGRLHRYLIHHMLAVGGFAGRGRIFPVSTVMLAQLDAYRRVLEQYSLPRLDLIEWTVGADHNIVIRNETLDLYRFFDATAQAEYLYACVAETIDDILPREIAHLERVDRMRTWLQARHAFGDPMLTLLVGFLDQGRGTLSKRAVKKEFSFLLPHEIEEIEQRYREIFLETQR